MGLNYKQNKLCAIKLEHSRTKTPQLIHEAEIIKACQGGVGFPDLYYKGNWDNKYNVVAMELLGPSLEDLFNICQRKMTLKTIIMFSD